MTGRLEESSRAAFDDRLQRLHKDTQERLLDLLNSHVSLDEKLHFLPSEDRSSLITSKRLSELFPDFDAGYVKWLVDQASRTVCILLLCFKGLEDIIRALNNFRAEGFNDNLLPVSELHKTRFERRGDNFLLHNCFSREPWDLTSRRTFYNEQWAFIPYEFDQSNFACDIGEQIRLPLTFVHKSSRSIGAFGEVREVIIHSEVLAQAQNVSLTSTAGLRPKLPRNNKRAALKTLKDRGEGSNVSQLWWNESSALRALEHQHVLKPIASFRQADNYHLVLPLADTDLRKLWNRLPTPERSPSVITAAVEQIHGLTDALAHIHGQNWRHGDLKPENILVFKDNNAQSLPGRLVIADFGISKHHSNVTINRKATEPSPYYCSVTYEPPDYHIGHEAYARSRMYDVWSLGVIYLEFVTWLVFGTDRLAEIQRTALHESEATKPWTWIATGHHEASVSQTASTLMSTLRNHPDIGEGSALGDLVKIIQEGMLVVSLPPSYKKSIRGYRNNAEDLAVSIKSILVECEMKPGYLTRSTLKIRQLHLPTLKGNDSQVVDPRRPLPVIEDLSSIRTEPRPCLVHKADHSFRPRHKLKRSKSFSGAISDELIATKRQEAFPLKFSNLNHITQTRSNLRTQLTHSLRDQWCYVDDDAFAATMLRAFMTEKKTRTLALPERNNELCEHCEEFDPIAPETFGKRLMSDLRDSSEFCDFCNHLYLRAQGRGLLSTHEVFLEREGGQLKINGQLKMKMRICRSPDTPLSPVSTNAIPIGLPNLDRPGRIAHIRILQSWLKDCDTNHNCMRSSRLIYCPKRLLYLDEAVQSICKLVETKDLGERRHHLKYAALSHPWGLPESHQHFKTTASNRNDHLTNINVKDLPANYKDAIRICRAVGINYLWIDSMCILQATDHHPGDFKDEAANIQDIFTSADFVIAASSAQGTCAGFLNPRSPSQTICLPRKLDGSGQESCYYISDIIDDFEGDVLNGSLNERGWVMQERALARRTIFFTSRQTYFECGCGVRCETLGKLQCEYAAFLGDSNFPANGMAANPGAQLCLIYALYQQYSALKFTKYEDKAVAISGMELRLTKHFGVRSGAGVFKTHRERWLLWQRADDTKSLIRVDYPDKPEWPRPPSWSFMAYTGGITYIQPEDTQVSWKNTLQLKLTGTSNDMWLYTADRLDLRARILNFDDKVANEICEVNSRACTRDERAQQDIYITFDDLNTVGKLVKTFVLLGTLRLGAGMEARHYVLAVKEIQTEPETVYERIGAGWLPHRIMRKSWEPWPYFAII